jgi:predicted DCC family thiol-disulfide oxidoreductase YuxK
MPDVTVLYDERCALCVRLTARLGSLDGVSLTPIGSERGARLLRDLTPADRYAALHVVDADGRRRSGVEALPPLLGRLPGGRPAARLVQRFPRASAYVYDLVARNRMRLSRPLRARQARSVSRR